MVENVPVPVTEKGYVFADGVAAWWSAPSEDEDTPELRWPLSIGVYDRMRRQDAQVMSVLRAVTLPIRRTVWRIDPNGARDEIVRQVADDLGLPVVGEEAVSPLRTRDRFSWPDHLRHALLELVFGHSFFEQLYRIEQGQARLRKLAWRPPRTISRVDVAADGGLVAIEQGGAVGSKSARMEVNRLVAYVNEREGGNWLGQSLLRPAYKYWLLKDRALRTQAQTLERNGLGVPVYTGSEQPAELAASDPDKYLAQQTAELAAGKAIATAYRGGANAGAAIPHGADLELLGVVGKLPDADPVIRYYDEQIARAVLAHFLNLGTETGSWALGSTFADFFTLSLQTVAMHIADVTNAHVIEDIVDLNWGEHEPAPRLVFDEIGARHPATAEAIKALLDCGAIARGPKLEQHVRTTYGLPLEEPADTEPADLPAGVPEEAA